MTEESQLEVNEALSSTMIISFCILFCLFEWLCSFVESVSIDREDL